MKRKILVTGDSHCGAIARANMARQAADPSYDFVGVRHLGGGHLNTLPFFEETANTVEIVNPEYRERYDRFPFVHFTPPEDKPVYAVSFGLHTNRLWISIGHSSHRPNRLWKSGDLPLTETMLEAAIEADLHYIRGFLLALQRVGLAVITVEAPWPFKHHPDAIRYGYEFVDYVNSAYRERQINWLHAHDIPVVRVPRDLVEDDNFMKPAYRHEREDDVHHGSTEFGGIMLDRIISLSHSLPWKG